MPKFTIEIELGNAAMQSPSDVADALERLATKLRAGERAQTIGGPGDDEGRVRDANGNKVGTWSATWPEDES